MPANPLAHLLQQNRTPLRTIDLDTLDAGNKTVRVCLYAAGSVGTEAAHALLSEPNRASTGPAVDLTFVIPVPGIAADYLGLSVDDLSALLIELRERGLIGPSPPNGLRILDNKALEELANGHAEFGQVEHFAYDGHVSKAQGMGYQIGRAHV